MTCHALHCPNPALPGMPQCYDHWMMLPAKVREARPWVVKPNSDSDGRAYRESKPGESLLRSTGVPRDTNAATSRGGAGIDIERGQMELFA